MEDLSHRCDKLSRVSDISQKSMWAGGHHVLLLRSFGLLLLTGVLLANGIWQPVRTWFLCISSSKMKSWKVMSINWWPRKSGLWPINMDYIYNVYNLVEKSMFAKVVIKTNAVATRPASALLMVPRWNDQPTSPWIEIGFWQIEIAMDNGPFVDDLPIKKFWCSIAMLR